MKLATLVSCGLAVLASCATVPFTGRPQWRLVNQLSLNRAVDAAYQSIKDSLPTTADTAQVSRVQRVGYRLASATETFLRAQGQSAAFAGCRWSFAPVADSEVNACAFPGGKIFITDKLLAYCTDDTLLAAVLAHELGHVLANHAAESASREIVGLVGAVAVAGLDAATASTRAKGDTTRLLDTYHSLSQLGRYAYNRKQEAEADRIGLIVMSLAAYPPAKQHQLWQLLDQLNPTETFSFTNTHPTPKRRSTQVQANLPEAYRYWQGPPLRH